MNPLKPLPLLIAAGALMATISCTTVTGEKNTYAIVEPGVPGGEVIETRSIKATVTGIDATKRRVTLVTPSDEKFSVVAGPEVVNFDQIRIGDQLNSTITEEVVIRMATPGENTDDLSDVRVSVAPLGSKPGLEMTETNQIVGTVTEINLKKRKATLRFSDGSTKKFTVRKDVDLSKHKVGEKVVMRSTEIFAVKLEKP